MRRWNPPAWLLALPALAASAQVLGALGAQTPDNNPQAVLRACVAQTEPDSKVPVLQRCPQVQQAVRQLGYAQLLGSGWERRLDAGALQGLLDLSQRYQGSAPSAAPSLALLAPVLHQMRGADGAHSWWQDFKERLRRWLEVPNPGRAAWLAQLLSAVPPRVQRLIFYMATAGVAAMGLWILGRELLAARWFGRRRGGVDETAAGAIGELDAAPGELTPTDMEVAPPGERAALLLQLLLQALRRAGRVRRERVLSCRELSERAVFDSPEQRRRFAAIALWAERERYALRATPGTAAAVPLEAPAALAQGRELYAQLLRSSGPAAMSDAHEA